MYFYPYSFLFTLFALIHVLTFLFLCTSLQCFVDLMQKLIRNAKLGGVYDQGVLEVKGNPVYIDSAPVVVFNKQSTTIAAPQSSASSSSPSPTAVTPSVTSVSEVVEYYNVKCDRGMSWDIALATLARDRQLYNDSETALSNLVVNRKQRPEKGSRPVPPLFGFYVTKNLSFGKHFVIIVTEKLKTFQVGNLV